MEKCEYFKITNKYLQIYIKIPLFNDFRSFANKYKEKYSNDFENYLEESIDVTGKYLILTFILRNMEDILPYLNTSSKED